MPDQIQTTKKNNNNKDELNIFTHKLKDILNSSHSFLILPHVNMDGDALGTSLALFHILKALGKSPLIFSNDKIPSVYRFLPGVENVENIPPGELADCAVMVECPNYSRSPLKQDEIKAKTVVNIDHHPDNLHYGDLNWTDTFASSAGEIFFYLLEKMDIRLTMDSAICLYVAILTDTGGFQYNCTTYQTHEIVAKILREFNIPKEEISRKIYRESSPNFLQLLGVLFNTITIHETGYASVKLPNNLMEAYQVEDGDAQNFIRELNQIRGVHTIAFLRENYDGKLKVSLRSDRLPVNKVAALFDGGGHPQAAGCTVTGMSMDQLEQKITSAIKEMMDAGITL